MAQDIWLSMDDVCNLTGKVKEMVRRKCKRGEYSCKYDKKGKYKNYLIIINDLRSGEKQAKKYVELIEKTKGMKHK